MLNYKFKNLPLKIEMIKYRQLREKIIDYYSKKDWVYAIYEYGKIRNPGISDLDILIVTYEKIRKEEIKIFGDEILLHQPAIMNIEVFKNFGKFFDVPDLNLLYGKQCEVQKSPEEIKKKIALEFLIYSVFRILNMKHSKTIKVRQFLCEVFSLKRDFAIFNLKDSKFLSFIEKVKKLRDNWWKLEEPLKELIQIFEESLYILMQVLNFISRKENWTGIKEKEIEFGYPFHIVKFKNIKRIYVKRSFRDFFILYLPLSLLNYFELKGKIAKNFKQIVNDYKSWLIVNDITQFGFLPPSLRFYGLKHKFIRILRKAVQVPEIL